jgi:hypothetical protein
VAHANAVSGSTHYVAPGDPVPGDLPAAVRLVGPGVPGAEPGPAASEELEPAAGAPPKRPRGRPRKTPAPEAAA